MTVPATEASFADKMAYYRTQHTTRRENHAYDRHTDDRSRNAAAGRQTPCGSADVRGRLAPASRRAPDLRAQPASTHKGWITYQLTGVIHACGQYGELLARRSKRRVVRIAA